MTGSSALAVEVSGVRVGTLEYFAEEMYCYRFDFDPAWLLDRERPVLGQFFDDRRPGPIVYDGPPCWFTHLLPQGPLRHALAKATALDEIDEFEFYELLGDDLPGAVTMTPTAGSPGRSIDRHAVVAGEALAPIQSALPGMIMKMSVRVDDHLTVPVRGREGEWIAKFHNDRYPSLPRVEAATMSWAAGAGIEVPAHRLSTDPIADLPVGIPMGDGSYYLIERFDRRADGSRVHYEDFAQVLDRPLGHQYRGRYEDLAAVIAALCPDSLQAYVERLAFCVVAGNGDAHLKNWALLYPDRRTPRLSPAYDLVSTVVYPRSTIDDELALTLSGSKRFEDVNAASFEGLARACGRSAAEVVGWASGAAQRAYDVWAAAGVELAYSGPERARIVAHHARLKLR